MARYIGPVCRLCRRENMKLFIKGERCYSDKCSFDRRSYAPGHHGKKRPKFSNYGMQLREKQKVKRIYGMSEKQFRLTFDKANRQKGITGVNLLMLLERRLDNVVYKLGFVVSRTQARQLVRHKHFLVNGKSVNIPSYLLKNGDVVEINKDSKDIQLMKNSLAAQREVPKWLDLDSGSFKGIVINLPTREDVLMPIQEQLIVELYSK